MEYVNFGRAGVKVSRLALGLGFRALGTRDEATRVIEHAIDSGINLIDCSNFYGLAGGEMLSEEILAGVLKKHRDDLVITSKVFMQIGPGPNDRGTSRYHVMREVERSLRRLDTDHIDVYLLHGYDEETPLDETLRAMDDLITQGKVRYAGCSNFAGWQVCKALWTADRLGADPIICVQNPYSLLNRAIETDLFGVVRDQGLGVMAFSPLGAGLLSGDYRTGAAPPPGTLWSGKDRARFEASMAGSTVAVLSELSRIAAERGKTVAQTALNWVITKSEVTVAIFGCDGVEQLDNNLGAVGWALSEEEMAALDRASEGTSISFVNL